MLNHNKKLGRDSCFKCTVCGKYVSYDMRTITKTQYTDSLFDRNQEQWFPEEVIEFTHKKCESK